jgi:hypothetical protein
MKRHLYRAFGLNIGCDQPLPELPPARDIHDIPLDLSIETAASLLVDLPDDGDRIFAHRDGILLHVQEAGEFFVARGSTIRMVTPADRDPLVTKIYLLGSAIGLALHQRGSLVLHASAILHDGKVTLFLGESGAGKSTLAAVLAQHGYSVLADDVMPISFDHGEPCVWPGARAFKLWSDSIDSLGISREQLEPISNRSQKYYVMNQHTVTDAAYPVAEIIVLDSSEEDVAAPQLERLGRLEAVRALTDNTYRPEYLELLDRRTQHFKLCAQLSSQIPLYRLQRPWDISRIYADVTDVLRRLHVPTR